MNAARKSFGDARLKRRLQTAYKRAVKTLREVHKGGRSTLRSQSNSRPRASGTCRGDSFCLKVTRVAVPIPARRPEPNG